MSFMIKETLSCQLCHGCPLLEIFRMQMDYVSGPLQLFKSLHSWPLNNTGLNHAGPFIYIFFSDKYSIVR